MSEEILRRLDKMERTLSREIADNRTALAATTAELSGKIALVDQKVDMQKERIEDVDKRVECVQGKVNTLRVDNAVTKTKVGLLALVGGGSTVGLWEMIKRFLS